MSGIYWLASYPKSGNTWLRVFLRNLRCEGDEPADINDLRTGCIASDRDWLDELLGFSTGECTPEEVERLRPAAYDWCKREPKIGYHKIHDAYTWTAAGEPLIGRNATLGAVYIVRNPLDIVPSLANHWQVSLDEAIARMGNRGMTLADGRTGMAEQIPQRLSSWSAHVSSWVDAPGLDRLVIRYEDMLSDALAVFTAVARYLQLPCDPVRVAKAVRFSDFQILSEQESRKGFRERPVNAVRFFMTGRSGGWREQLAPTQVGRIVADHGEAMRRFGYHPS